MKVLLAGCFAGKLLFQRMVIYQNLSAAKLNIENSEKGGIFDIFSLLEKRKIFIDSHVR